MDIGWNAGAGPQRFQDDWSEGRGLGENLDFVRALGRIQSLEQLSIDGYYAKPWPSYLGGEMGVPVKAGKAFAGEYMPYVRKENEDEEVRLDLLCFEDLNDFPGCYEGLSHDDRLVRSRGARKKLCEFCDELREDELEKFRQFQEGTEDLTP